MNTGPLASAAWLVARGLCPSEQKWFVEINLDVGIAEEPAPVTRLLLEVYAEEWGYRFERDGRVSWIRVTDLPFVHGRDDHRLLPRTPPLSRIGTLVREIEDVHGIAFRRDAASIRSNVPDGDEAIRTWLAKL